MQPVEFESGKFEPYIGVVQKVCLPFHFFRFYSTKMDQYKKLIFKKIIPKIKKGFWLFFEYTITFIRVSVSTRIFWRGLNFWAHRRAKKKEFRRPENSYMVPWPFQKKFWKNVVNFLRKQFIFARDKKFHWIDEFRQRNFAESFS